MGVARTNDQCGQQAIYQIVSFFLVFFLVFLHINARVRVLFFWIFFIYFLDSTGLRIFITQCKTARDFFETLFSVVNFIWKREKGLIESAMVSCGSGSRAEFPYPLEPLCGLASLAERTRYFSQVYRALDPAPRAIYSAAVGRKFMPTL